MLISMTGFGRAEAELPGSGRAVAEIRSVNHRYLEVECRLPESLMMFEESIRSMAARSFARGQVRISVSVKGSRDPVVAVFQEPMARRYHQQLSALQKRLGLSGEIPLQTLLQLPQVMTVSEQSGLPSAALWKKVEQAVSKALAEAVTMRKREGGRLEKALKQRVGFFADLIGKIRKQVPVAQKALQGRLAERIQAALQQAGREIPEAAQEAVLREAASMVQATDVNEELERIDSHLTALRGVLAGQPAGVTKKGERAGPGRTLDFMAQELQREINTLGTKMRDPEISRWVVEFKGQIEKLREQAANIE